MISCEDAKNIEKSKLSLIYFDAILKLLERRIKKIAKTNRYYIKINEGLLLKIFYRKYYDRKIQIIFERLGFAILIENGNIKKIAWE